MLYLIKILILIIKDIIVAGYFKFLLKKISSHLKNINVEKNSTKNFTKTKKLFLINQLVW